MSDIQRELQAAFAAEYREHLAVVRDGLERLRAGQPPDLKEIFRRLHSLKGAARAVDLAEVERLAHDLEALVATLLDSGRPLDPEAALVIEDALEEIEEAAAQPPVFEDGDAEPGREAPAPDDPPAAAPGVAAAGIDLLRIDAARLGTVFRDMGDVAQAAERQDHLGGEIEALAVLAQDAMRALVPAGQGAAAPGMAEAATVLRQVQRQIRRLRRQHQDVGWSLDQSVARLRLGVEALGLVAAEAVFGSPSRMLRDLAQAAGIAVEPVVQGLDLEAQRRVLQALKDPLIQLLRNAVSHGAEPAEARARRGLPPELRVTVTLAREGDSLRLSVADDGPGPNLAAITARGLSLGLLSPQEAREAQEEHILRLVFEPGFSTRGDAGPLAGRGQGLAIVAEAVAQLRGHASLRRRPEGGSAVDVRVSLSVSRETVLLVDDGGGQLLGLPSVAVQRLVRLRARSLERRGGQPFLRIRKDATETVPVIWLAALMGRPVPPVAEDQRLQLALLGDIATGKPAVAIAVARLADVRSLLVHPPEAVGLDRELVEGLLMLEGEVPAMLLSAGGIVARARRLAAGGALPTVAAPALAASAAKAVSPTILVVDDSITTRTLEKSILEAHGYHVLTAVDGLEGLETLLAAPVVDMVLADIEMPRMDGFGLLEAMKKNPALAAIPVIIMTSRDAAADIRRGLDLGASAYLAKQGFDQRQLLETIERLL